MSVFFILLLVLIVFLVFVIGVSFLMTQYKNIMLWICSIFVIIGFLLYVAIYLSSGEGFANTLFAAIRGLFSTARMFTVNNDHGTLLSTQGTVWLAENIFVQILFWLCHLSALMLLQAALITLFGRKLIDGFRLFFGLHNDVYIIKGCNKNAIMLGENIATYDGSQRKFNIKRIVLFLAGEDDDEKKIFEKVSHFGGIVKVLDKKNDLSYYLEKVRLGKRCLWERKYKIILMPNNDAPVSGDAYVIAEYANKNHVGLGILDIFAITSSEWERGKIEALTQTKDGNERKYKYTFHIINEIDLLVRQMIEKHPPFECPGLSFNEKGIAKRNFNIMVLGFGTVGQAALLRLIMNGQFVGSRMHAVVIDRKIKHKSEHFLHCHPALNLCCKVEFKNFDVRDEDFFKLLPENRNIDYIVVALGNDEKNKQIALDIQLEYERKNKELPFIAVFEKNGNLYEEKQDEKIFIFGCMEEIYKESVIIREGKNRMAKAVHEVYGGKPQWHELDWFLQESNRAAADFIPAMLKLAKLKENDAFSKETLTENSEIAEILAQTEHLRWNAFHAVVGYIPISIDKMHKRFDTYGGVKNTRDHLDFSRRDSKTRLQVCLVPWDKLDEITQAYRDLAKIAGNDNEQKRDFKVNDREIVKNVPKFLKAAGDEK